MNEDTQVSEEAAALSRLGASKGGIARAKKLGAADRSEIARKGAEARWGQTVHIAYHTGELKIGDLPLACAVLEDGTRVLSQSTVLRALGRNPEKSRRTRGSSPKVRAPFLLANNLQRFISDELRELAEQPVRYRVHGESGTSWGYDAYMLPGLCEVYMEARRLDTIALRRHEPRVLFKSQEPTADAAETLIRGLARVGIIALIDEATGYQEVRARHELEQILAAYVQAGLRPWIRTFPDEFFREIYRLQRWEYKPGTSRRHPFVGKLVNKYIYEQLPPGVLDELRRLNPRTERGYRAHKHFQFLTGDTGNPHLERQISTVTTLLRIARDKQEFEDLFERAFAKQLRLPLVIEVAAATEDKAAG
jgi:P63C domain